MNNLFLNTIKLIFVVKLTNSLLKPIDCLSTKISARMCSIAVPATCTSSQSPKILMPPESVKGMKKLDKSAFEKRVRIPVIYIEACSSLLDTVKILREYKIKLIQFKTVIDIEQDDKESVKKAFVLDPNVIVDFNSFSESVKSKLKEQNVTESDFNYIERLITFDNWSVDEVFKAVLPEDVNFSGYSVIGHIAHLNLRNELLDFKYVLGEIILSKVKRIKTVVNKVNIIDNAYRSFQMELITGVNNMQTVLRENGCVYELDFSKVYWNSRLSTEHERIVRLLDKNDVLYDVFAGVGPFVIPAAKKGCLALANDLNPDSYKWLMHNIKLNKVGPNVECFNCDAKHFISVHLKKHILNVINFKGNDTFKVHVTMNLPSSAVGFINDFRYLFTEDEYKCVPKEIVCHLYCFIKVENFDKCGQKYLANLAKEFVESHLRGKLNENLLEIYYVRKVAPTKGMFRVSFLFEPDFLIRKSVKRNNKDLI